jgi:hypothetical protein
MVVGYCCIVIQCLSSAEYGCDELCEVVEELRRFQLWRMRSKRKCKSR